MFITVFIDFINTFAKKYKFKLFTQVILSLIAAGFEFLGLSLIYGFVILLSEKTTTLPFISQMPAQMQGKTALIIGVLVALTYILKDVFMICYTKFQNLLLADMSDYIFKNNYSCLMGQNYFFTRQISQTDKLRILDGSITYIMTSFVGSVLSLFVNIVVAFGILSYLFIKFKYVAVIISVFIFLIWFAENSYFKKQAKKFGELFHKAKGIKTEFLLSTVNAQKDVIIYNKENSFTQKAYRVQQEYSRYNRIINTNHAMPTYFTEIGVMSTFVLFVVLMLINNAHGAQISAGLAAVAAVILRIVPTINRTQGCLHLINSSRHETLWFMDIVKSLQNNMQNIIKSDKKLPFNDSICLENLNFYYDSQTHALKDINFTIKKGEFIGILGSSGSGKTTLFNTICALFLPQSGSIKADGIIIDNKNAKMWQNNISILSQEFSLPFNTVWQNITMEPNKEKGYNDNFNNIKQALISAGVFDEIEGNLEKNVQELSCGQKHRIALARAFYFDRELIMLDEATSALDVESEDEISKSINAIKGKKTIIAIAHRIKTLKNCDRLIHMEESKIVGIGTLEELLEKDARFKKLIELSQF